MKEEKIVYKNTTKMEVNEIITFQTFAMKKVNLITSILFALIFVGIGVGLSFVNVTCGIITIVCGLLGGFVLLPYLMKESIKKQTTQSFGENEYLNTFEFNEETFKIVSEEKLANQEEYKEVASQELSYEDLYQAVLFRDHLFIYISARESFIVNYKGMTQGTIGEVIDLLKSKEVKIIDKNKK